MNTTKIILFIFLGLPLQVMGEEVREEKRIYTLWSDNKNCYEEGASLIAIEAYRNTYKVAACASQGCRIAVKEFGKNTHSGNFRDDPKFKWLSETEFEATISGSYKHFYHCLTKER